MKIKVNKMLALSSAVAALLFVALLAITPKTVAQGGGEGANGQGTLLVQNDSGDFVRRQFAFSARRYANGSVKGNAVLHNPAFENAKGQQYNFR